jgi:hypothetical protein
MATSKFVLASVILVHLVSTPLQVEDKQPGIRYELSVTKIPGINNVTALGEAGRNLIAQMMKTTATLAVLPIKGKQLSITMTTVFGNPGIDFCAKGTHDNLPALVRQVTIEWPRGVCM